MIRAACLAAAAALAGCADADRDAGECEMAAIRAAPNSAIGEPGPGQRYMFACMRSRGFEPSAAKCLTRPSALNTGYCYERR